MRALRGMDAARRVPGTSLPAAQLGEGEFRIHAVRARGAGSLAAFGLRAMAGRFRFPGPRLLANGIIRRGEAVEAARCRRSRRVRGIRSLVDYMGPPCRKRECAVFRGVRRLEADFPFGCGANRRSRTGQAPAEDKFSRSAAVSICWRGRWGNGHLRSTSRNSRRSRQAGPVRADQGRAEGSRLASPASQAPAASGPVGRRR